MIKKDVGNCISLVVVNHDAGSMLAKCLELSYPQVDEIVVVDNASTDSSLDECEKILVDHQKSKIIRNKDNLGFATACNIGFSHSTGDVVLFLNPDCYLKQDAVAEMFQVLSSKPSIGMVGGMLINLDGTEQGGGRRSIPTPWRAFVRAFGLHRFANNWPGLLYDFYLHKTPVPSRAVEVEAISGACIMVKRKAVEDVGVWDEEYFLHCEDLDWCMRFHSKGWKILFVPSARVVHILNHCGRRRPVFVEWHKHKGMIRFYRKHFRQKYPIGLMWLVYFGVWLRFAFASSWKLLQLGKDKLIGSVT